VLEICQEDNLTQRRKDAKKNQVFRTEDAKIFGLNCGFALAILTLLGNESALGRRVMIFANSLVLDYALEM
jgi:hypothetical protein